MRVGPVEGTPVMRPDDKEAQHLCVDFLQYLANGEEIAQRLRHLLVIDPHEPVVHPGPNEWLAIGECRLGPLGLSNFVLMMRKLQIGPTTMEIKTGPKQLRGHGRALKVPTRTALPVIGGPYRL